ncbi:cytochrome P450 [Trametes meyenii]|nr:cytochrome P450 [Trametes meyenii]
MLYFVVFPAALSLYVVWRVLRNYVIPSPLDNLPGPPSKSLLMGSALELMHRNNWRFLSNIVSTYGPVAKLHGPFGAKFLHVYDPKVIHSVLVKDADVFTRGAGTNTTTQLMIGPGLLAVDGATHKRQRKMLNPVFSAAHMRGMTPFFHGIVRKLRDAIKSRVEGGAAEIDLAGWMGRAAIELVGQGGLGHSFDPLTEETSDDYTEAVKALIPTFLEVEWVREFLAYAHYLGPAWFRRKLLDLVPHKNIQRLKNISDVMYSRSVELFEEKKRALENGDEAMLHRIGEGKDVMSVLLRANIAASEEDRLPDEELIGQISTFILAGVDTTSNALSRILFLLAKQKGAQDKLREELLDARERYGEDIPYDELSQLPYLDAVCRETLRLYSPAVFVSREAHQDVVLPLSDPVRGVDGAVITEIFVPRRTFVLLNLQACNSNKVLWGEDAHEWKPERWLEPLPRAVDEARIPGIYANLMSFGAGSYSCIGFKFSQLEMKTVIAALLPTFVLELSDKPIIWNFSGVVYPTMGGEDIAKAEMVLKLKLVKD